MPLWRAAPTNRRPRPDARRACDGPVQDTWCRTYLRRSLQCAAASRPPCVRAACDGSSFASAPSEDIFPTEKRGQDEGGKDPFHPLNSPVPTPQRHEASLSLFRAPKTDLPARLRRLEATSEQLARPALSRSNGSAL